MWVLPDSSGASPNPSPALCAADHGARAICSSALRAALRLSAPPNRSSHGIAGFDHCGARRGGDPLHTIHADQRVKVRFGKNASLRADPVDILK